MKDIVFTITIPAEKVEEFRRDFLAAYPVPTEVDGKSYTEKEWFEEWSRHLFLKALRRGKEQLALQQVAIDTTIIQTEISM